MTAKNKGITAWECVELSTAHLPLSVVDYLSTQLTEKSPSLVLWENPAMKAEHCFDASKAVCVSAMGEDCIMVLNSPKNHSFVVKVGNEYGFSAVVALILAVRDWSMATYGDAFKFRYICLNDYADVIDGIPEFDHSDH